MWSLASWKSPRALALPPFTCRFRLVEEARADSEKYAERRKSLKIAGAAAAAATVLTVVAVTTIKRWHGKLQAKGVVRPVTPKP
jgi:hypothetical protein